MKKLGLKDDVKENLLIYLQTENKEISKDF